MPALRPAQMSFSKNAGGPVAPDRGRYPSALAGCARHDLEPGPWARRAGAPIGAPRGPTSDCLSSGDLPPAFTISVHLQCCAPWRERAVWSQGNVSSRSPKSTGARPRRYGKLAALALLRIPPAATALRIAWGPRKGGPVEHAGSSEAVISTVSTSQSGRAPRGRRAPTVNTPRPSVAPPPPGTSRPPRAGTRPPAGSSRSAAPPAAGRSPRAAP